MVDKLLSLALGDSALLEVAPDVDIEEGRNSADAHSRAVLGFDCGEVAEVQPLNRLLSGLGRTRDIIAVNLRHLPHTVKGADLLGNFLSEPDVLL